MTRVVVALIAFTAVSAPALAQNETSQPTVGASGVRPPEEVGPTFGASSGNEILRHRSPIGTPCLDSAGFPRPHIVNPNVYDHVISAKNSCAQRITIQVCYYKSLDCMPLEVPGRRAKGSGAWNFARRQRISLRIPGEVLRRKLTQSQRHFQHSALIADCLIFLTATAAVRSCPLPGM